MEAFLQLDATEVASQLASLIDDADAIAQEFNLATVRSWPQMAELMRFLAHAMRVSGKANLADEVEDVLCPV